MVDIVNHIEPHNQSSITGTQSKVQQRQWEKSFWEEQRAFDSQAFSENESETFLTASAMKNQESAPINAATAPAVSETSNTTVKVEPFLKSSTADVLNARDTQSKKFHQPLTANAFRTAQSVLSKPKVISVEALQTGQDLVANKAKTMMKQGMVHLDGNEASVWLGRGTRDRKFEIFTEMKSIFRWFGLSLKKLVVRGKEYSPFTQQSQARGDH